MQYVTYIYAPVIAYQIRSYQLLWTMSFFWYHWTLTDLAHRGVIELPLQLNLVPQLDTSIPKLQAASKGNMFFGQLEEPRYPDKALKGVSQAPSGVYPVGGQENEIRNIN